MIKQLSQRMSRFYGVLSISHYSQHNPLFHHQQQQYSKKAEEDRINKLNHKKMLLQRRLNYKPDLSKVSKKSKKSIKSHHVDKKSHSPHHSGSHDDNKAELKKSIKSDHDDQKSQHDDKKAEEDRLNRARDLRKKRMTYDAKRSIELDKKSHSSPHSGSHEDHDDKKSHDGIKPHSSPHSVPHSPPQSNETIIEWLQNIEQKIDDIHESVVRNKSDPQHPDTTAENFIEAVSDRNKEEAQKIAERAVMEKGLRLGRKLSRKVSKLSNPFKKRKKKTKK